ncbi:MAG TPA: hypothetical protein VF066_11930 [Thermoleophilaceae bacterium]
MRGVLAVTLTLAVAAALPADALAAYYRGSTSQGRRVLINQDSSKRLQDVRFGWKARCSDPGYIITSRTHGVPPFDRSDPGSWADYGSYSFRDASNRIRVAFRASGRLVGATWSGHFTVFATVRHNGRVVDRCRVRDVGWRVKTG